MLNPQHRNASFFTVHGRIIFKDGIGDLTEAQLAYAKGNLIVEVVEEPKVELEEDSEKEETVKKLSTNWTVAKIKEYAAEIGYEISEDADTKKEIINEIYDYETSIAD